MHSMAISEATIISGNQHALSEATIISGNQHALDGHQ